MAAACDFGEFPGGCAGIFGSASVGFVVAAWRRFPHSCGRGERLQVPGIGLVLGCIRGTR
jgi:hypothetical protein